MQSLIEEMKISASQLRTSEHATMECGPDAYMLTRTNSKNGKCLIMFYRLGVLHFNYPGVLISPLILYNETFISDIAI